MQIRYITNVRIPTTRAQGFAIIKMCEEFLLAGEDVELIIPNRRSNEITDDPFIYYNIKNKFKITRLRSIDLLGPFEAFGKLFYWIDMLSFLFSVRINTRNFYGLFYTRDYLVALILPQNSRICLEIHDLPSSNFLFKMALRKSKYFVVLNDFLKKELVDRGADERRILISPSGVSVQDFDINISKDEAREKLSLSKNKKIVSYTGHLYGWKGVDTLAKASELLPDVLFLFVGGVEPELTDFKNKYKYNNIIVRPSELRENIPLYLKASDVLVLPNTQDSKISSKFTSPLKMFEYMASRVPIVASDLPSIREVLNENNCFFAEPDNPESFKKQIERVLSDYEFSLSVSNKAKIDVQKYTWENRAKAILINIKNNEK